MSEGKKILIFAAGILLAIGLVGTTFLIYNNAKTSINSSINQYSNLTAQYDNLSYSQYENGTAKGDEIVRLINGLPTANDGVTIKVITKMDTTGTEYNATNSTVETSSTSNKYINPNAVFNCSITRNANGVITVVTFTQR